MIKKRIRALFDRPSPKSLGMLGLAVDVGGNVLQTDGLVGRQAGTLTTEELDDLVSARHALKIAELEVETDGSPLAALWIGDKFASDSDKHDLSLPPLPEQASGQDATGRYWIAPTSQVFQVVDSWLIRAFRKVIQRPNEDLAKLMSWVLPERDETRAALWLTARDEPTRNRDLNWWIRLARDHGQPEVTPQSLVNHLQDKIEQAKNSLLAKVFGLCAPAQGGDNDIADFIAQEQQIRRVSFGKWLRTQASQGSQTVDRVFLQKLGREMLQRHGALFFCLEVLRALPVPSLNQSFVIDGIRHLDVLKSIQCLVGPDRFTFAYVDRPIELRRRLLIEKEHLAPEIVDQVLDDFTEKEIPLLRSQAELTLDGEGRVEQEGRRLLKALSV